MRIVSLSPSITEILFALDAGNQIVGNTFFCDFPEEAKKIPKAGDFSNLNIEKIRKFDPDIVFTSTVVQEKANKAFQKENFRHIHYDPRSIGEIYENISDLGKYVSREKKASQIVNKMKEQENKIRKTKFKRHLRVYTEEWFDPPMISGNWVPDVVNLAGGNYFPLEKRSPSSAIQFEKLLYFDPEVIFLSDCGFGTKSDPGKVYKRKEWQNLTAVWKNRVIPLDESILNRPGPRILQAAREIQKILLTIQVL